MSTQITPHFTLESCEHSDYATAHNIQNTIPEELKPNGDRLCKLMEDIRSFLSGHYGQEVKISISSVYRGPALNKAITSQHMRFEAMDWHPSFGDLNEVFTLIAESDIEFDQLIEEHDKEGHTWIHTSVADKDKKPRRDVLAGEKGLRLDRIHVG